MPAAVEKRTADTQMAMTVLPSLIPFYLNHPLERSAVIPKDHHPIGGRTSLESLIGERGRKVNHVVSREEGMVQARVGH